MVPGKSRFALDIEWQSSALVKVTVDAFDAVDETALQIGGFARDP